MLLGAGDFLASNEETMEETTGPETLVSETQVGNLSKTAVEYARRGFKITRTPLMQNVSAPGPSMEVSG